ncbi:hypothetical protein ACIA5D_39485 [Actinoplanes sp. NPDC051513]|uniref:hypothetical protein n=1 Tax=Actinoplanes sp. NPDC051513 TaxID=3363908 RepID=UPI0037B6B1A4
MSPFVLETIAVRDEGAVLFAEIKVPGASQMISIAQIAVLQRGLQTRDAEIDLGRALASAFASGE